jgi:hypothetical protein
MDGTGCCRRRMRLMELLCRVSRRVDFDIYLRNLGVLFAFGIRCYQGARLNVHGV